MVPGGAHSLSLLHLYGRLVVSLSINMVVAAAEDEYLNNKLNI